MSSTHLWKSRWAVAGLLPEIPRQSAEKCEKPEKRYVDTVDGNETNMLEKTLNQ